MEKTTLKYRTWYKGIGPRPIKPHLPGWAGTPGYTDGVKPQAWHCKPFMDAATYGLELVYPWDTECVVTSNEDGTIHFEGDFTEDEKACNMKFPPFMNFAPNHYGFTSSLDIETPANTIFRIEPHPRFFTDHTGEVPIPVAGHMEGEWWPRIFFVVFKSPRPGEKHVFRKGEGYAQILVLPKKVEYEVREMTPSEACARARRDGDIVNLSDRICTHSFKDDKGHKFNNKYKVLGKICQKAGPGGVDSYLKSVAEKIKKPMKKCAKMIFKRIRRKR